MNLKVFTQQPAVRNSLVWIARIITGACFIFSGIAKADDPWGTIFKIEQYLSAWGLTEPRSLVMAGAVAMAAVEFLLGISLLLGIFRRNAPWGLAIMMLFFTPLTAYIAIFSPVDDCGCFGDAFVISNTATLLKNIALCILTIPLILWNRRVMTVFTPGLQWIVATLSAAYIFIIAMIGYHIQPPLDFRAFPIGTTLPVEEDMSSSVFIYSKDGKEQEFDADKLPSADSGWEYVGRKESESGIQQLIIENTDGDDITEEIIDPEIDHLLLIIPEPNRADLASTMQINRLWRITQASDSISMTALIGDADAETIGKWKDLSMAEYPVYSSEATTLKSLARGIISVVYLNKGIINSKIAVSAISTDKIMEAENGAIGLDDVLAFKGGKLLGWLTFFYVGAIGIVFFAALPRRLYLLYRLKHGRKKVVAD